MSGGVPYLGSKISLVSKSEIRYEGILYTIDTKESTVALAKVRSYGTEGRPTDRPVAPRDEIYEYIIFRASDIKDLHVCEPPKPQPALSGGLPNDPAIVQHSPPISASYHIPYGQPSFGSLCSVPAFQHYPGQSFPHLSTFFPPSHSSGVRSATSIQPAYRKSPTSDAGVQVSGIATPEERSSKIDLNDQTSKNRQVNQTSAENGQKRSITINRRPQQQRMRGSQRRNRGRRQSSNRSQTPLQFDCEYDFEQANAEFIELENKLAKSKLDDSATEMPTEGENGEEVNAFYDREKSFFDNISCEASRRNNKEIARFDWRQERKLNVETFGVSRSDSWLRRRRGRGGFRGRGFRNRSTRGGSIQKSVTFENDKNEETVNAANELKNSEIPTIEIIVEKEKEWNEPADESKSEWK